jgi:hypothetical protein
MNGIPSQPSSALEQPMSTLAQRTADEAKNDFEEAGYSVDKKNDASKQDFIDALQDPDATAIWFIGHGVYNNDTGEPYEMIEFADHTTLTSAQIAAMNLDLSRFTNVTLCSCGQDLQSWKDLFTNPNLKFTSWKKPVSMYKLYWYQWRTHYNILPVQPPPAVHSLLALSEDFAIIDTINNTKYYNLSPVANITGTFILPVDKQAYLNGKTFNFIVSKDNIEGVVYSCMIQNGVTDFMSASPDYNSSADFDIIINDSVYYSLLENPNSWNTVKSTSFVTVNNYSNGTIPDSVILDGYGITVLGQGYINSIPTLSQWGLIILGSVLTILGVIFLYKVSIRRATYYSIKSDC